MIFLRVSFVNIEVATLLLRIAILSLFNKFVVVFISIFWKDLLIYYDIYFINIIIDVK